MVGGHFIRHHLTTQSTISLSSGGAELHGIGKGIAHALVLQSLYRDLGVHMELRAHSDATAAIGIARRRGLGKLRQLDCDGLWIQQQIRSKKVQLVKVLGTENPADAVTKYLDSKTLQAAIARINMFLESGRPLSALAAPKE